LITLNRPEALNALTHTMCLEIEQTLRLWERDTTIELIVIDGEGDRAFCAGGDIAEMYDRGMRGDFSFGPRFWRDEYRLNALLANYPKPIVTFLHGFTMGGGVGIGCHASHRIVSETSQIAMPEVTIGLVPDVGGSLLLRRAPGRCGAYLGLTAARMDAGDAIYAGFADKFVAEEEWPELKSALCVNGLGAMPSGIHPQSVLAAHQTEIDTCFAPENLGDILDALETTKTNIATKALKSMKRHSPLAMASTLSMLKRLEPHDDIRTALALEYRFTSRSMKDGDFLEGIRAQIVDKDRNPVWKHRRDQLPLKAVEEMLAPLGAHELKWEENA